ncbi:MAG: Na+/H+ antiporter subunit C [Deltaproteobacteria bacterium]|nr:MAG: Na+/H+ antiporter subunit C [Deltaproteobacteria bacterium]
MPLLVSIATAALVGAGVWLILRAQTFPVILGLMLLSYAANLVLFASGGLTVGRAPILIKGVETYPDPIPQALVLTAIVIGFAMTAFVLVLALKARFALDSDHVDGDPVEPQEGR